MFLSTQDLLDRIKHVNGLYAIPAQRTMSTESTVTDIGSVKAAEKEEESVKEGSLEEASVLGDGQNGAAQLVGASLQSALNVSEEQNGEGGASKKRSLEEVLASSSSSSSSSCSSSSSVQEGKTGEVNGVRTNASYMAVIPEVVKKIKCDKSTLKVSADPDPKASEHGAVGKCPPRDMKRLRRGACYKVTRITKWGKNVGLTMYNIDDESDRGFFKPPSSYNQTIFHLGDKITLLEVGYSNSRNRIASKIGIDTSEAVCLNACEHKSEAKGGCCSRFIQRKEAARNVPSYLFGANGSSMDPQQALKNGVGFPMFAQHVNMNALANIMPLALQSQLWQSQQLQMQQQQQQQQQQHHHQQLHHQQNQHYQNEEKVSPTRSSARIAKSRSGSDIQQAADFQQMLYSWTAAAANSNQSFPQNSTQMLNQGFHQQPSGAATLGWSNTDQS